MMLNNGRTIHAHSKKHAISDIIVQNSLITMYSKCGSLEEALDVWKGIESIKGHQRNVVTYTAIIEALGQYGKGKDALEIFSEMLRRGIQPDDITITSLLMAFSHSGGMADQAMDLYNNMEKLYGIIPTEQHRYCIIDAFARKGNLEKAEQLLMQFDNLSLVALRILLGACSTWQDVPRAERLFKQINLLYPDDSPSHVLMANIYASAGQFDAKKIIWEMMKEKKN